MKELYFTERKDWRDWLEKNFDRETEIWLVFPNKSSGKPRLPYNDAVEEALCFGWIDSIVKSRDKGHAVQRFTPRNPKSTYSQLNKERLKWLMEKDLVHPSIHGKVREILAEKFIFPLDIIKVLEKDPVTWENYQKFPESYKRIRIAYIDGARVRPEEFERRLYHFIKKTRENKMISAYGGAEKYY